MKRTLDATRFNEIANDPAVRPWLGMGRGAVDLRGVVGDPRNFCFLTDTEAGGYIMQRLADGLYEAHTISWPDGGAAVGMMRLRTKVLDFMFSATDCVEITTKVPDGHARAAAWVQCGGFSLAFTISADLGFVLDETPAAFGVWSMTYQRWALDDHHRSIGVDFHEKLRADAGGAQHAEEWAHDCWVGATIRTCAGGQAHKGVVLYNRWALQAGYAPVTLLSVAPVVVDVRDAVVQLNGETVEILRGG